MASFMLSLWFLAWPLLSHTLPDWQLSSQDSFAIPSKCNTKQTGIIDPCIESFIEETISIENIMGLSVTVVQEHSEPEFRSWGYRTEEGDATTPDTLFYIGSLSKAFCVSAVGLLIDDFANRRNVTALPSGLTELTWRTRMKDLLPDWRLMDEWASEKANLRDILSHVSGIPRHDLSYSATDTPLSMLKKLEYLQPAFELRERFSYNSIMFMVAAHVIETYSGQPYTTFVEKRIFLPLGMTDSTFSLDTAETFRKLSQGWTKHGRRLPTWFAGDKAFLVAGPGGVMSNAIDMSKWILMWIGEGTYDDQIIIPLSAYHNATYAYTVNRDHPIDSGHPISGYGMGWDRFSYRGHDIVTHMGGLAGYSTTLAFLPSDGLGVSVLINGAEQGEPALAILYRIVEAALGLPTSLPGTSIPTQPKLRSRSPDVSYASSVRNLESYLDLLAGTYHNPGYGTLTLCSSSSSNNSYCAQVQSDFAAVDGDDNEGRVLDLLAAWPQCVSSHVRMRLRLPDNGDKELSLQANTNTTLLFAVYFTSLFPKGYGRDRSPFKFELGMNGAPYGKAEFVITEGSTTGFQLWDEGLVSGAWFERVGGE